jgi:competence protein ComEA
MMKKDKDLYLKMSHFLFLMSIWICMMLLTACKSEEQGVIYTNETVLSEPDTSLEAIVEIQTQYDVYVQVNGEVKNPGVYQVRSDFRVFQVIDTAGGFTELADKEAVNMARPVQDEMVIYVPAQGEQLSERIDSLVGSEEAEDKGKVNLNTASKERLMTLPGIGESKASAIITYREEQGGFTDLSQLKEINGIKDSTYEKLVDLITL